MVRISARTQQLWPEESVQILKDKGLCKRCLNKHFKNIFFPGQEEYNNYRFFYKLQIQELPLFVIQPISVCEIKLALNLAHKKNLSLRTINGRHSSNIQNPDFYLDVTSFQKIKRCGSCLKVDAGQTQGRVYKFLDEITPNNNLKLSPSKPILNHPILEPIRHTLFKHAIPRLQGLNNNNNNNYVYPGGSAGSVGIAGLTSVGGIGVIKRTIGLAIDAVESYDIVVPPTQKEDYARYLHVTKKQHPDLFWALSGGLASNFGVLTKITYTLPQVNYVITYSLDCPWSIAKSILDLWFIDAPKRSKYYNENLSLHASATEIGLECGGLYVIPPFETVTQAIASINNELKAYIDLGANLTLKVSDFDDTINALSNNRVYYPFSATRTFFSQHIASSDEIISQMELAQSLNGLYLFGVELMGGQISKISADATAFYARESKFFYDIFTYSDSSNDVCSMNSWSDSFFNSLYDPINDTVYVGFQIPNLENSNHAYYGSNAQRLENIKQKYDSYGVMDFPQGL